MALEAPKLRLTIASPVFPQAHRLVWEGDVLTLGRGSRCDLTLPLKTLSAHHMTFQRGEMGYEVADVGSRNGTLLNEERLTPHEFRAVRPGMVLRTIDLTFHVDHDRAEVLEDDAERFTMQTATLAVRQMAREAVEGGQRQGIGELAGSGGAAEQVALMEVVRGADRGRRYRLEDRLQRAFVGTGRGALIKLHDPKQPEHGFWIERTELGFAIMPGDEGADVRVDGERLERRVALRSRQRVVMGGVEWVFLDPVEELMLALDGVLPYESSAAADVVEEGEVSDEQFTPETSRPLLAASHESRVSQHSPPAGAAPEESARPASVDHRGGGMSGAERLILVLVVLVVLVVLGVVGVVVMS